MMMLLHCRTPQCQIESLLERYFDIKDGEYSVRTYPIDTSDREVLVVEFTEEVATRMTLQYERDDLHQEYLKIFSSNYVGHFYSSMIKDFKSWEDNGIDTFG